MVDTRKPHAKLPGRLRIIQTKPTGAYWITVPKELADDLGWGPGDVLEFVRKGRHVALHKRIQKEGSDDRHHEARGGPRRSR